MGVPTVTIVTDQFVTLARGTQKSQGLTDMCFVTVPHPIGMLPKEQVDAKVDAAFGDIVKAATQWQPVKEKEAAQESPYPAKTFKFTGTYADVNKLFAKRKWSLSLPIIPPTVDRVREMLKGTKHAPSEVLWVVPPRQGMLTVELVAVLGVMAGAQPEHMPLLLATIDAMKAPEAAWRGTSTTTAPTSPLIVISGPIVEKLKLNAGTGTAGGENPVTNALGYFVNLVGDVVGGSVPPNFDKSTQGSSFDLVANVICENAKETPWDKTFAEEQGFTRDDSVDMAEKLKQMSGAVSIEGIEEILLDRKLKNRATSIPVKNIRKYFSEESSAEEMERKIIELLEKWRQEERYAGF